MSEVAQVETKKRFEVDLPSGKKVKISITNGTDTIERKAKIQTGFRTVKEVEMRRNLHKKETSLFNLRTQKKDLVRDDPKSKAIESRIETIAREIRLLKLDIAKTEELTAIPLFHNVKSKDGKCVTYPQTVPSIRIKIKFDDNTEIVARSCCKPPDLFKAKRGREIALRRVFLLDQGINPATGKPVGKAGKPKFTKEDRLYLKNLIKKGVLKVKKQK